MSRQPKGRVTISQGKDGWFYAWPSVGRRPNGKTKQKKIRHKTAEEVKDALDAHYESMKVGSGVASKITTFGEWGDHWLENVIRSGTKPRSYNTWRTYESQWRLYIRPALGGYRLRGTKARLEPEHVETLFAKLPARLSMSYRLHMFRVIDGALKQAVRKGKADRNVCDMIETPDKPDDAVTSMTMGEATAFVAAAAADEDDGVRYLVGILLGPRQGEALGLRWTSLNLDPPEPDEPYLRVIKQVQRRTLEHGCADPVVCVQTLTDDKGKPKVVCRTKKCPPRYQHGCSAPCGKKLAHFCPKKKPVKGGCSTHKTKDGKPKKCPPLCPPRCAGHARHCPEQVGGLIEVALKARRADEKVPLGWLLTELLRQERERQQRRYSDFHMTWDPNGFVFQGAELGRPRDPRRDYDGYQKIRAAAGLKPGRSHVARHTAGSMMTAVGTDIRVIQNLLGHRKITTTQIYTDVAMGIKREAVDKVAAALFDGDLAALLGSSAVARKVV